MQQHQPVTRLPDGAVFRQRGEGGSSSRHTGLVTERRADRSIRISLVGDLDHEGAQRIEAALLGACGDSPAIEIDASGITFLDSAGLRLLLRARQAAQATGRSFVVRDPSAPVARLLRLTGLDDLIDET